MNILGLEEFNVLEGYDSEQYYKFVVEGKDEPFFCTKCSVTTGVDEESNPLPSSFKKHDTRPRTVADLDLRGKKVAIEVLQRRYKCPHCDEIFTEYFESIARNERYPAYD